MLKDSGKHFDMIRDKIGVDLRKDLHGITLYGPDTDKTHGVAIVFSTVDRKLLLKKAEKADDHKVTKHGDIKIHSWTGKHEGKTHPAAGTFYKSDVLVFAANADRVAGAIDVLNGKSAGLGVTRRWAASRLPARPSCSGPSLFPRPRTLPPSSSSNRSASPRASTMASRFIVPIS